MIGATFAIVAVFGALLGIGNFVLGKIWLGILLTIITLISIFIVVKSLATEKWEAGNQVIGELGDQETG
jgi:hypothetical protein